MYRGHMLALNIEEQYEPREEVSFKPKFVKKKTNLMSSTARQFHGMYPCQVGTPCPSYSAGFLTSRDQLLSNPVTEFHMKRKNTNMETASYFAMGGRGKYDVWRTVDALDFAVEHLSMYERMLHSQRMRRKDGLESDSPIGDAVYAIFLERLRLYEQRLRHKCAGDTNQKKKALGYGKRTVGVMPYYAAGAGSGHTRSESKALYLNITIRSIRCHFAAIAVSCLHPLDRQYLTRGQGLPHIDHVLWIDPEKDLIVNKPPFLGISTVRAVQQQWMNISSPWTGKYDFFYYTEADQVLHLRAHHRDKLFQPLLPSLEKNKQTKLGVLTPHRLNAVPRSDDYLELQEAFLNPDATDLRSTRFNIQNVHYKPKNDPYYANMFEDSIRKGGWVRRELNGYGSKRLTRVDDDLNSGSCCYLRKGETEYPYQQRGKSGGVRLDDIISGEFGETEARPSPVELLAIGDHGFGILAALCCHICARRGRLGRHCDNYCQPAHSGNEDCALGVFADPAPDDEYAIP